MNKFLLMALLPCFLLGMRKSPSMYDFQVEAKHVLIYKVEDASSRPDCSYCNKPSVYFVLSFGEFRFSYCEDHFRAAGFVQPKNTSSEGK